MNRLVGVRVPLLACLFVLIALLLPSNRSLQARPNIRTSFFNAYPSAVGSRLDDLPSIQDHCGVCHYQFTGAGPRNPYGAAVGDALPGYPNTDAGRQQAMRSIENLDSDGDGYATLIEITDRVNYVNTPTFPGLSPGNVNQVSGVDLNDIQAYLVPSTGADTEAPNVAVIAPNGGESWTAGAAHTVSWNATDNVGVVSVDLFYKDGATAPWTMIAHNLSNSGSFTWFLPNTPTANSKVRALARDAAGNQGEDQSNADFTILLEPGAIVPTTLRDFHQPGSQPFGAGEFQDQTACTACHGGYDPSLEPGFNWKGSMMAQSMRDPIFKAALLIAEQDASSSGDLCLRCHTPFGWLSGRSNPTDGGQITALDRDGVSCDFCHRMVDPIYQPGISPVEDQEVLNGLAPGDLPSSYANGQYVIDPQMRRRGPFSDPLSPHPFLHSPFHQTSEFCGTCHDVSNPALERTGERDYAPGPLDEKPAVVNSQVLFPVERTYSEWLNSAFPAGVFAPEFAGNRPDGTVRTCQDCHLRDVEGRGCNDPGAPIRPDLPLHDMMGGNSWVPTFLDDIFPGEVDPAALAAGSLRAISLLQKAALLELTVQDEADSFKAEVTITNRTGHKLPTGYPEGRRIWVHLVARDATDQIIYESGAYDPVTGVLARDRDLALYETELGLSPSWGQATGVPAGPSFHFVLNDTIYKDNRIPPLGFTNSAFAAFGGAPVDPHHEGPGPRYADYQNWDQISYGLPEETRKVSVTLYYQTISSDYVEFLRDENVTDDSGDFLHALWMSNGRCAPIAMASDSMEVTPGAVADPAGSRFAARAQPNPFRGETELRLNLPGPARLAIEIFDVQGRRVRRIDAGMRSGAQRIVWDGKDDAGGEAGSGIYWARVLHGRESLTQRIVLVK